MKLKTFFTLVLGVAMLFSGVAVRPLKAQTTNITETRITTDPSFQSYPAIYGDRIVWMDFRNGNFDIYMYDLSTGTETQITNDPAAQMHPSMYGDRIVWEDSRNYATTDLDIYMYDLSTGIETQITGAASQTSPAIFGNFIVWEDGRNWDYGRMYPSDIFMYDLSTGMETQITTDPADQGNPAIYGSRIVWEDLRAPDGGIYMYDLSTARETRIVSVPYHHQDSPAIYGNRIVWRDDRNNLWDPYNYDIYMYDLSTGMEAQITPSPYTQGEPAIFGNRIVWTDWSYMSYNRDIFMYDLSTRTETQITTNRADQYYPAIYGDRIVWQDSRNGPSDIYMAELSFASMAEAMVDLDPGTLNLRSNGEWITAHIQLPEGYNPEDIDASTVLLNGTITPVLDPKYDFVTNSSEYLVDYDSDGALERMVRFDRASIASWIYQSIGMQHEVSLTITGELTDGTLFEGTDIIFVIYCIGGGSWRRK